jgi:hypothetical protein
MEVEHCLLLRRVGLALRDLDGQVLLALARPAGRSPYWNSLNQGASRTARCRFA